MNKIFFASGLVLLVYGYLCRLIPVNFFWESKSIGWALLFIAGILYLFKSLKKKERGEKKLFEKIGIVVLAIILIVQISLAIVLGNSEVTAIAKEQLVQNQELVEEVGAIKGMTVIPKGGISLSSDDTGETGVADLRMIVKGTKRYADVVIKMEKSGQSEWTMTDVRFVKFRK